MSETEHIVGKLKPVQIIEDIETTAKELCIVNGYGVELDKYYKTWVEKLVDDGYREYFVNSGKIYQVLAKPLDPEQDIFKASKNSDGEIEFELRYYNGSCSINGALQRALKKLKGD